MLEAGAELEAAAVIHFAAGTHEADQTPWMHLRDRHRCSRTRSAGVQLHAADRMRAAGRIYGTTFAVEEDSTRRELLCPLFQVLRNAGGPTTQPKPMSSGIATTP